LDDETLRDALFSPLYAPFSPYSDGHSSEPYSTDTGPTTPDHPLDPVKEEFEDILDLFDDPVPANEYYNSHYNGHYDVDVSIPCEQITQHVRLVLETPFLEKYWRNDRKNLQCFPVCPEFGDYLIMRSQNLRHKLISGGKTCGSPVVARLEDPDVDTYNKIIPLSRINLISDEGRGSTLSQNMRLTADELDHLRRYSLEGFIDRKHGGVVMLHFKALCWKLDVELSKKRRPKNLPSKSPQYTFEAVCLVEVDPGEYMVLAQAESKPFHINSTRTLARELEAISDDNNSHDNRKRGAELIAFEHIDEQVADPNDPKRMRHIVGADQKTKPLPEGINNELIESDIDKDMYYYDDDTEVEDAVQVPTVPPSVALPAIVVEDGHQYHDTNLLTEECNVTSCYMYWLFLGLFGGHHFYLGRNGFGVLYACTLGLFGIGWLCDIVRVPSLVKKVNTGEDLQSTLGELYNLWFPLGLLGAHRFALGEYGWGMFYLLTLGGNFGVGFMVDLFRMRSLYKNGGTVDREKDAFICWCGPFGILGAHHFYLGNYATGVLYCCTLGLFFVGWVRDGIHFKELVQQQLGDIEMTTT